MSCGGRGKGFGSSWKRALEQASEIDLTGDTPPPAPPQKKAATQERQRQLQQQVATACKERLEQLAPAVLQTAPPRQPEAQPAAAGDFEPPPQPKRRPQGTPATDSGVEATAAPSMGGNKNSERVEPSDGPQRLAEGVRARPPLPPAPPARPPPPHLLAGRSAFPPPPPGFAPFVAGLTAELGPMSSAPPAQQLSDAIAAGPRFVRPPAGALAALFT